MNKLITRAGVAALVAPFALAAGVAPASADPDATITVEDCNVESSKDISYIAYLNDGDVVEKDESIGTKLYDLETANVEGGFDEVKVKSGQTVHREAVRDDCDGITTGDGGDDPQGGSQGSVDNDDDQNDRSDNDGNKNDDGKNTDDRAEDDRGNGQEQADGQAGGSDGKTDNPGSSGTTIGLEGCDVVSGKDISYIAFFLDGELVQKDEDIDGRQLDLGDVSFDFDQDCETADETDTTTGDAGGNGDAGVGGTTGGSDGGDTRDDNREDVGENDREDVTENQGGNAGGGQVAGVEGTVDRGEEAGQPTQEDEVAVLGVEETAAVPTEVAAGVGAEALPQTGAGDKLVMLGAVGLGLLALGGAAMVIRRRLGSGL